MGAMPTAAEAVPLPFEDDQPTRTGDDDRGGGESGGPVMAATSWVDSAALVEDCVKLGYLRPEWRTLDPTYGRGSWWRRWRPDQLVCHDLAMDGVDFRYLPEDDGTFDVAVFDPPYVCVGGRQTSTIPDFLDRYGLADAPKTPAALQKLIDDGLAEVARVVVGGGLLLVKCQSYVWGGKLWPGTFRVAERAERLGLELVDHLVHISGRRPQPPGRRQVHARRNHSDLLVLRKPARRRRRPTDHPIVRGGETGRERSGRDGGTTTRTPHMGRLLDWAEMDRLGGGGGPLSKREAGEP